MKRQGYLFEKICEWDNLLLAYRKARKGKTSCEIDSFSYDWELKLYRTQQKLLDGSFNFGNYHSFKIYEPKEREIMAAPFMDRVVHHAICNILGPILDKPLVSTCYACRKKKGLHKAVKKAYYMFKRSNCYYRLDIRKFYYTIDHELLLSKIERKIKDKKLLDLLRRLLATHHSGYEHYFHFDGDDLFDMIRNRGLPIGNLSSQLFANFYLSELDHYVIEKLKFPNYVRYMDDILVFADDRNNLRDARVKILEKLSTLRLKPNIKKDAIQKNTQGVDFLGFRFSDSGIRIRNQNLNRFRRKLRVKSKSGNVDLKKLLLSFNGHLGYLLGGHSKKVINDILMDIEFKDENKTWKLIV